MWLYNINIPYVVDSAPLSWENEATVYLDYLEHFIYLVEQYSAIMSYCVEFRITFRFRVVLVYLYWTHP